MLIVNNVSNAYISRRFGAFGKKEEKQVLRNVSLEIHPGEIHGLVGESGCGKTTLGKCILGLLDYEGEIILNNKPMQGMRASRYQSSRFRKERASMVQAVFQDPSGALNPVMQAGWILEEPLRVHRIGDKKERTKRVDQMLDLIGLDASYKKRKPGELSSGQKQRISIGCALMLNPSLIIADEPVSALDVSVGAQILNLFRDLNKRLGLSLLFISHNLNLVYYLCDRISVMKQGRIVEQGTADEVYSKY
ncbi:ABC transporter ATP-binding protein [Leadbettera azotonutricia]|uniref:ABC transporter ATP-binding protein n=1 Tax=Leadbettera azotonutricia TaxID=150829 RepID=UPI0002DFFA3B|nr:dipeptide/oligopeptide/nickel ABC transporter ATP-binding protein [Leadbettera azotonutricia]